MRVGDSEGWLVRGYLGLIGYMGISMGGELMMVAGAGVSW